MPKHKDYAVTLISSGIIVDTLYYGPFCHNWWISRPSEKRESLILLYPIRLHMKTLVSLKDRDFIIEVVETSSNYGQIPGYICKCDGIQSELCDSLTAAVNSVYKKIFQTNAKYSGPAVMGFDIPIISEILLKDLSFRTFIFSLGKLNIWVLGIGKSNKNEWNFAGTGYKTSFIHTYQKQRCVYLQELDDDCCQVTIYSGNEVRKFYVGDNPELVWKKIGILQQYKGKELFGLENSKVQRMILSTPSCTLEEWDDDDVMDEMYRHHLRRRIPTIINWQLLFKDWHSEASTIIELQTQFKRLYPSDHKITDRELRAWKSMLKNVGCTRITPFNKEQSECEFWSRSSTPTVDQENLKILYKQGFINPIPVHFQNKTQIFWNSFQESMNINKSGFDGKTRILSIIAKKFSYEEIKSNLNDKPIITREKLSVEKQEQLQAFLMDKANVVMSSYKTDAATSEPVHYLKQTKIALWKKYHEQYPDGIQRTSFFTKLEGNRYIYRENLGGLCLTCQKYGYEIFSDLIEYINKYITQSLIQKQLITRCENLKRFLKRDYEQHFHVTSNGMTFHDPCISHCLLYAFNQCTESHTLTCNECQEFFNFFADIEVNSNEANHDDLQDMKEHLLYYLAHQTRKVYLNSQFNTNLLALDDKTALILVDYKMKILPKTARETKSDWFGKKGWTLHSVLVYTKTPNSTKLQVQAFDHWSPDTRQDSWFTASSLNAVLETLDSRPESVIIMSDNGGHYHNADLMMIMAFWPKWYNVKVKKWVFLEAGEAKTAIDSHHAQITHAINRYVRGSNTLPGNSNWFEWQWPTSGDYAGCILARSIPNFGPWTTFTPTQLEKLQKREIAKPNPDISTPTISHSNWEVPLPNSEHIRPERLTKQVLVKKLKSRGIELDGKENKEELAMNLEKELYKETEHKKSEQEKVVDVLLDVTNSQTIRCDIKEVYPLKSGWALKENQKFGKKGAGKRMTSQVRALLEGYFMAGNADKSNRYTAQDMKNELDKCAQEGEIDKDDVPKVTTIQNWISKTTREHREEAANRVLNNNQ
ncbi:hypothetical protein GLOIN_2v1767687 [Rhizophagus clarus]|uniref:Uncharacterized protein n=1 Tax=Rhizophagus clarus TaxID=94130 RepID=A0A8H3KQ45_9GLOM|nr:hypothetical protein GLOIN_2v1767687 [Rhizophagus clarus]